MRIGALVPFAVAAVLIATGSTLAIVSTVHHTGRAPGAVVSPTPLPSGARTAELSHASRLAYWREGKLWVSNLDGSLRHFIAASEDTRRIALTRWTPDGGAVSFVESGLSLAVVTPDGARTDVGLPFELRTSGYRIVDVRWSPDARRVAATLLRANEGRSDAFVADMSAPKPAWTRVTDLEDLFVGDWISADEFLAYTAGGVIAAVRASGVDQVRLLTGATGVSPVIGPEGRIHYLVGRLTGGRDPSLPYVTATRASAWSAATDGSDVRRESSWEVNDVRIDARLADGRYLVHRGSTNAQGTVIEDVQNLPANAGVIERLRLAPDGRSAYGFTSERIVRVDLTKLAPSAADAVTVFLDTSGEADVWFPTQLSLARGGEKPPAAPLARYVFGLGGHIWQMDAGVATLLRPGPVLRRTATPAPRWAPGGEHALAIEQAGQQYTTTTLVAVSLDRAGNATRLGLTVGAGRSYSWSPSGSEIAIAVDKKGVSGLASDAELEVRFLDPSGRGTRAPIAATEVAWTTRGLYLLGAGSTLLRSEGEGPARPLLTKDRIVADPRADPSRTVSSTVSGLDAPPDGAYASVRLQALDAASSSRSYIVVVGADGAPVRYLRSENLSDASWSPAGSLLGFTLDARTANERIQVIPAAGGDPVATADGRFAGWSPDGKWYYVGRVSGLFAYPVAPGTPVRVGPAGVPVSAAPR